MRIIKFRAWDTKEKIMFAPSSINFKNNMVWVCDSHGDNKHEYELINENSYLMQFTGLKDKNGKEIYEGDILKSFDPIKLENGRKDFEYIDVVVWRENGAYFHLKKEAHLMSHVECPEIIGNIHETPELLRGEK